MKLLTTSKSLDREFSRLIAAYQEFYWATAWAGINSKQFDSLVSSHRKIKRIIVGIHFYQTHPDFIATFIKNENLQYIMQPEGTFHPKIYLFQNGPNKWELLIGSGNFTAAAFNNNREATILICQDDKNANDIYLAMKKYIDEIWKESKKIDLHELKKYRATWEIMRPKINSLAGRYGSKPRKPRPIHLVPIINRTWREFFDIVRNEKTHGMDNRLRVIDIANKLFGKVEHFSLLNEEERKFIAGIPNHLEVSGAEDWGYFGSMMGAGIFKNKVIGNNINVSDALDQIPIAGQITKRHYESFIQYFKKIFAGSRLDGANNLSTATRLLTMKRPDVFVCLDNENRSKLCKDFGIIQHGMNYERYWSDIIERIYDSEWWRNPEPMNEKEEKVSSARSAFLDSLYYKGYLET